MPLELRPIEAKMALTQNGLGKLAINPYQGCAFACEFCSAIKMSYFTGRTKDKWDKQGWGAWVDYKTNLIELLQAERGKISRAKIHFGNATDLYQPIERRLKLVPPILEFFLKNPPLELEIQTRGAARDVARDIPLLQELSKRTSVLVSYSIHTNREDVRRLFEPKAPSLGQREAGLQTYFESGIKTRISCMPLLPLDPEGFARRLAPFVTNHVWVAPMYHRQLTAELFRLHYPEWTRPFFIEQRMLEIQAAFNRYGVHCYFRSATNHTHQQRLATRQLRKQEQEAVRSKICGAQLRLSFEGDGDPG
jgi:DNA repair photolyase